MRTMVVRALLLLAALAAPALAQPLPDTVLQALQQAQVPADAMGAVVLPAGAGLAGRIGPRWAHLADRPMQPASALKLLTSVVALDQIGPNVRGFTELLTGAPQQGDVLAGDLVLRGGADPEFDLPQLWAMLLDLRQVHGIREIAGDVVIDRTLFRPARPERDAAPFDERPEFAYNLVPDALQLNSHLLQIEISSEGGALRARALPPLPGLQLDTSAVRLSHRPCAEWAADWASPPPADAPEPGQLRVRLQGSFPKACTQRPSLFLIDPLALAERQLRWLWASLGGSWAGQVRDAEAPVVPLRTAAQQAAQQPPVRPGAAVVAPGVQRGGSDPGATRPGAAPGLRLLASHQASPWGELLRTLNKQSSNVYSRLLYLQLGLAQAADNPEVPTRALADRAVRQWLAARRIDAPGLVLDNGSGLSRAERITPRALAQVLQAAHQARWAPDLLMSLPVAAVDGTLRNRFASGPAAGQARLKTGLLRDVSALAGYVPDPQGRPWVLVAFINHPNAGAARPALDALVDWVAGGGLAQAAR
jgi:D-alanyl-D-alanine carboxypeptidase/D-alanyl-D-alanine-endopeptidase (penicillin-binding protein 4)